MLTGAHRTATSQATHDVPAFWFRLWPVAAAIAFLVVFGIASWVVSSVLGGAYGAAEWLTTRMHVPPWMLFAGPLLLIGVLGSVGRIICLGTRPQPVGYDVDPVWYRGRSRASASGDTTGIPFELEDGPLAGRVGRLRDSRFRLWVTRLRDGSHVVKGDPNPPTALPRGATLAGAYVFSEDAEMLVWTPKP